MALKEKKTKMPPSAHKVAKKPKKAKRFSYAPYIFKVLKDIHPRLKISKQAMSIMDSCVVDTFDRLASEARRLLLMSKKDTVGAREIQSAVRLAFPGELATHAVGEGKKRLMQYKQEVYR